MRVVLGLLLVLLGLCGSAVQQEGFAKVGEIGEFLQTAPRDTADDSIEHKTKQNTPDIWAELRALRDTVSDVRVELYLLQRDNSDLQTRQSSSESELLVSKFRIGQVEKENADLQKRLSSSESELLVSKSRIDRLEKENAEKPKVAFYTALTDAGQVGPFNTDVTLKYSKVFTNVGNAYSPSTGFFTAPVKGVYYFQFTATLLNTGSIGVQVFKNNQQIMFNYNNNNSLFEIFCNSVILELIAGDEVHLVLPTHFSLYDNAYNHNTFSGALLFPL
ncbi:uncharacterized protein ACO6RY_17823 [Pungitius sinensis]